MAKYIIDIEDEYTKDWINDTPMCKELCMPISVPNRQRTYHVSTGFKLEPYTEPDRKAIEDEVWSIAREIAYCMSFQECIDTGMLHDDDIYNSASGVLEKLTYQEAKAKFEAWRKQKEEIRVGDEVEYPPNKAKGIVVQCHVPDVYAEVDKYAIFTGASVEYLPIEWLTKTGRVFPEVAELLKKMREEDD